MAGGLEVAIPVRDRGIDLIAYLDLSAENEQFVACPIQMKASQEARFGLEKKYEKIANLLVAYVWHVEDPAKACVYALTYREAFDLLDQRGHTKTDSWRVKNGYSVHKPRSRLAEGFRAVPHDTQQLVPANQVCCRERSESSWQVTTPITAAQRARCESQSKEDIIKIRRRRTAMKKSTQVLVPVIVSFVVAFVLGYLLGKFGLPSWWKSLLLNVAGSIIALILLYGVYILCSVWASRDKACPELWWIPKFNCFRYVIRNNPGYDITDIHSRAWLRDIVPKGEGCGENSFREFAVVMGNRVMIPKGDDYVLVSFRLAEGEDSGLVFVLTDKFGANPDPHRLSEEFQEFLVEYSAKIQTGWLLKYEISRTYVIPKFHEIHGSLFQVLLAIQEENEEAPFPFLSWRTRVIRVSI